MHTLNTTLEHGQLRSLRCVPPAPDAYIEHMCWRAKGQSAPHGVVAGSRYHPLKTVHRCVAADEQFRVQGGA